MADIIPPGGRRGRGLRVGWGVGAGLRGEGDGKARGIFRAGGTQPVESHFAFWLFFSKGPTCSKKAGKTRSKPDPNPIQTDPTAFQQVQLDKIPMQHCET